MRILFLVLVVLTCLMPPSYGYEYHSRILIGGFGAKEKVKSTDGSTVSNDAALLSSRFFLDITKLGSKDLETILDLRDKHDFFEKLERERLDLTGKNHFQLRQISVRLPKSEFKIYGTAGRFPLSEAGGIHLDGIEIGKEWPKGFKSGAFGGLNPRRDDQTYVEFNSNAFNYGAYLTYQTPESSWEKFFYLCNSFVMQHVGSQIDRSYWYTRSVFQPGPNDHLFGHIYLDFVPSVKIQNLYLRYSRQWMPPLTTDLSGSIVDVIEYHRSQGIREKLSASPYRESQLSAQYRWTPQLRSDISTTHGRRDADDLWKHQYEVSALLGPVFNEHISLNFALGFQNNFTSNDLYSRIRFNFYSEHWEVNLLEYLAHENYKSEKTLIPIMSQIDFFYYFSKSLFTSASFEHATDSSATIFSGFLKVGYRFGTRETASVRSRAPQGGFTP